MNIKDNVNVRKTSMLKHKPKARGTAKIMRSNAEAWDLALANKELVYSRLNKYVKSHSLTWYRGEDLRIELESYAWEGMFQACRRWDSALGKLSTYAYPTVDNHLRRGTQILIRMGGNVKAGGNTKTERTPLPWIDSIQARDESRAEFLDLDGYAQSLADTIPQPWQDPVNSFEDKLIEEASDNSTVQRIKEIVSQMPEPHRTVFQLIHFEEATHEKKDHALGEGLTLKEVSLIVGKDTTIIRKWLFEAEEYIRYQLGQEV